MGLQVDRRVRHITSPCILQPSVPGLGPSIFATLASTSLVLGASFHEGPRVSVCFRPVYLWNPVALWPLSFSLFLVDGKAPNKPE